ncbi:MAG: hypothetical protein ACNI27_13025 [Desulfovibrio sp.]
MSRSQRKFYIVLHAVRMQCEGMLVTLCSHFDPDMEDNESANIGERVAYEYLSICTV